LKSENLSGTVLKFSGKIITNFPVINQSKKINKYFLTQKNMEICQK